MRGVLAVVLLAAFALAGWSGPDHNHVRTGVADKRVDDQWMLVTRADFDGDDQDDLVLGEKSSYPSVYRRILVRTRSGETLLDISDQSLFWLVTVAPGPLPILVVGAPDGNWLGVQAFMFSPQTRKMERVNWDGRSQVRGREVQVDPATGAISMWTESGKVSYRFKDGALRQEH